MKARPFIKWVGGKQRLAREIIKRLGPVEDDMTYYEPFLGGGGVFLELRNMGWEGFASLGDSNFQLMNAWYWVKVGPEHLIEILREHQEKDSAEHYAGVREVVRNQPELTGDMGWDTPELAAAFIYLNKTCYNGLYRENKRGQFNAAYGKTADGKPPVICDKALLFAIHNAMDWSNLFRGEIGDSRFQNNADMPRSVIYLDPPYHNAYTGYTAARFTDLDQQALANKAFLWSKLGAKVVVSNSDTEFIRDLYGSKGATIEVIKAARTINRDVEGRKPTGELLITL